MVYLNGKQSLQKAGISLTSTSFKFKRHYCKLNKAISEDSKSVINSLIQAMHSFVHLDNEQGTNVASTITVSRKPFNELVATNFKHTWL